MIRLSYVQLKKLKKFADGATTDEVNTEAHGEMYKDGDTIRIGTDCLPVSAVWSWREYVSDQPTYNCPEPDCGETGFASPSAVGAHRWFKHKIPGKNK